MSSERFQLHPRPASRGALREQRLQLANAVLRVREQVGLHLWRVRCACDGERICERMPRGSVSRKVACTCCRVFTFFRSSKSSCASVGGRAAHGGDGSKGEASRATSWRAYGAALRCGERYYCAMLQSGTRTFFAAAISCSISSVDRLRASSRFGMAMWAAAARDATRVVAAGTRSALVETSANASSMRRKSDIPRRGRVFSGRRATKAERPNEILTRSALSESPQRGRRHLSRSLRGHRLSHTSVHRHS